MLFGDGQQPAARRGNSGKTEAAFSILTQFDENPPASVGAILGPLKALIDRRLNSWNRLCREADIACGTGTATLRACKES